MQATEKRFSPTLCLTHSCNLNCLYCYQHHDNRSRMNLEIAKRCIKWIASNVPDDTQGGVEISFIGGEPLMEFDLMKETYYYAKKVITDQQVIFYATTNGTLLNGEMKSWFSDHRKDFVLGLSLDGMPETHNHNRSNSYELIDIDFFAQTWPQQGLKMTLSDYSLRTLAVACQDVVYRIEGDRREGFPQAVD